MSDPLIGPRAKVARTWEHVRQLEAEITEFMTGLKQGESYDIAVEIEPEPRKEVRRLRVLTPIPALRWGILVGDIVHNARSALDHLIEQATIAHHGTPLPRTDFPVFTDRDDFFRREKSGEPARSSGLYAIRGVSPQVRAVVEKLQPYQRGSEYRRSPLWVLHELWNMDKHRVVPVVGISTRADQTLDQAGPPLPLGPGKSVHIWAMFPFEDGTPVTEIELMPDQPATGVKMNMRLVMQVQFGDGPLPGGEVIGAMRLCATFVSAVVQNDFAPLF